MNEGIPPTPPQPPAAQATSQAGTPTPQQQEPIVIPEAQIEEIPQKLAQIRRAVQIEATLIRQNLETREAVLNTARGEIRIRTDVPLPPDKPIIVQIPPGPQPQITIVLPTIVEALSPAEPPPPPATQPTQIPIVPIEEGAVIQATVVTTPLPTTEAPVAQPTAAPTQPVAETFPQATPATSLQTPLAAPESLASITLPQVTAETILPTFQPQTNFTESETQIIQPASSQEPGALASQQPTLPESGQLNLSRILQAQISVTETRTTLQTQQQAAAPTEGPQPTPPSPIPAIAELPLVQEILNNAPLAESLRQVLPTHVQQVINTLQPPQTVQLNIVEVTPPVPNAPPPPQVGAHPSPLPLNTEILGDVVGQTARGEPILTTPHGNLVLNTRESVPIATQIAFTAKAAPQQVIGVDETLPLIPLDPLRAEAWPALEDALEVITQQAPEAGQTLRASIPTANTPARLPNTALFFLAALKSGVLESWMGQPQLQALMKAERRDLIERLTGDFRGLARQSTEPLSGEWRSISIPFFQDEQLSQLQFFVRHQFGDDEEGDSQSGDKKTRFVVNLKLSQIGPMQIDGLLKQKQLDIVLRTEAPLTERLRHELREAYRTAIEAADLNGGMTFHAQRKGWIEIEELQNKVGVTA